MCSRGRLSCSFTSDFGGFLVVSCSDPLVEDGKDDQGQQGRGQQAAYDHGGQWPLHLRADARVERHGHEAESRDQGRHCHGAQSRERTFLANVSHELRTPLASIKGYAETIREGALEDKTRRLEFVKTIEEQAVHLSKLVDDLLDLSSIESGHRPPKIAATDIRALAEDVSRHFAPAAAERGAVFTSPSSGPSTALADAEQVRQVIVNLIDNAIKYTESWGRVEKARTREAGGTGLGLAIVKHLVETQGGCVWVESRQPGGSAFFFSLRAA